MVRTMAGGQRKAVAGKAPRKAAPAPRAAASTSSSTSTLMSPGRAGKSKARMGLNPVTPQPTPKWQKGIAGFLKSADAVCPESKHCEDSEDSNDTVDLKDTSAGSASSALSMFDEVVPCSSQDLVSSQEGDAEQPGPSSRH